MVIQCRTQGEPFLFLDFSFHIGCMCELYEVSDLLFESKIVLQLKKKNL